MNKYVKFLYKQYFFIFFYTGLIYNLNLVNIPFFLQQNVFWPKILEISYPFA